MSKPVAIPRKKRVRTNIDTVVSTLFLFDYLLRDCPKFYLFVYLGSSFASNQDVDLKLNEHWCYYRNKDHETRLRKCNSCIVTESFHNGKPVFREN
jgi:hypothetical protein